MDTRLERLRTTKDIDGLRRKLSDGAAREKVCPAPSECLEWEKVCPSPGGPGSHQSKEPNTEEDSEDSQPVETS